MSDGDFKPREPDYDPSRPPVGPSRAGMATYDRATTSSPHPYQFTFTPGDAPIWPESNPGHSQMSSPPGQRVSAHTGHTTGDAHTRSLDSLRSTPFVMGCDQFGSYVFTQNEDSEHSFNTNRPSKLGTTKMTFDCNPHIWMPSKVRVEGFEDATFPFRSDGNVDLESSAGLGGGKKTACYRIKDDQTGAIRFLVTEGLTNISQVFEDPTSLPQYWARRIAISPPIHPGQPMGPNAMYGEYVLDDSTAQ